MLSPFPRPWTLDVTVYGIMCCLIVVLYLMLLVVVVVVIGAGSTGVHDCCRCQCDDYFYLVNVIFTISTGADLHGISDGVSSGGHRYGGSGGKGVLSELHDVVLVSEIVDGFSIELLKLKAFGCKGLKVNLGKPE